MDQKAGASQAMYSAGPGSKVYRTLETGLPGQPHLLGLDRRPDWPLTDMKPANALIVYHDVDSRASCGESHSPF